MPCEIKKPKINKYPCANCDRLGEIIVTTTEGDVYRSRGYSCSLGDQNCRVIEELRNKPERAGKPGIVPA